MRLGLKHIRAVSVSIIFGGLRTLSEVLGRLRESSDMFVSSSEKNRHSQDKSLLTYNSEKVNYYLALFYNLIRLM